MELTGWQTVAVALGGGVVTGTAALLVAVVGGRQSGKQLERRLEHENKQQEERLSHERSEQWTDRRVRAADDFATGVEQAILGVRDVIGAVGNRSVEPVVEEAKRRLDEAVARIARVRLLFPENAAVVQPATDILFELDIARGAAIRPDSTFAWEKLKRVYELRDRFNAAAIIVIAAAQER